MKKKQIIIVITVTHAVATCLIGIPTANAGWLSGGGGSGLSDILTFTLTFPGVWLGFFLSCFSPEVLVYPILGLSLIANSALWACALFWICSFVNKRKKIEQSH